MTGEIALVLGILLASVALFASERIRVDVVALMVLLALTLTGILTTEQALSGFASTAVVTVWAIYMISGSLTRTGIADFIGSYIGRLAGQGEMRLVLVIMVVVGVMSAFMNNIGAAAVLLPVVVGLGRKKSVPASKLLIPLAFGSLLGGVTTLIGTPPNLLASDALAEAGFEAFRLFDYAPMGVIILFSSVLYMVFVGRRLLPSYQDATHHDGHNLIDEYRLRDHLVALKVQPHSSLIGKTIVESRLGEMHDVTVVGVLRDGRLRLGILPNAHLRAGDVLYVNGNMTQIQKEQAHIGVHFSDNGHLTDASLTSEETAVTELVVSQKANFVDQTLQEIDFRGRYGLNVLAIWREESPIFGQLAEQSLHLGDTLLVHGRRERLDAVREDPAFLMLRPLPAPGPRLHKAPLNLLIFLSVITAVGLGWLHISVAVLLGAVLVVLTGCLNMDEAYAAVEWKSVFLIAGMLPMGIAMKETGTAQFLADHIIGFVGGFGPRGVMVGLFVLTTILTAFMSNAAAAVLAAPIAIQTAVSLGVDPHAFVMGIAIAASNSFVTPIGHQACILVYGPGGYRFFDYAKAGLPLTLLIWLLMVIFLPMFWPLG